MTTPHAFRSLRPVVWACTASLCTLLLASGGCSPDDSMVPSGTGSSVGNVSQAGNGAFLPGSGGSANPSPGVPGSGSTAPVAGGSSNGSTGGSGNSSGGMTTGGSSNGAAGSATKPCVDVQPPPDPNWPDANCEKWAKETKECTATWFASYCDVSCGRCVPAGGSGGSTGSGGTSSSGGSTGSAGSTGTAGSAAVDCSTKGLPNVTGGNGYATRYWDCCQPHCAQFDGHKCGQDGTSKTGDSQSSCSGGGSYACYDESPKAVNDCLSYGYIAKANPNCGGCYRIQFTGEGQHNANDPGSKLIKGKQMIVKVSNTGGDVANNQFDLMIPGGGVGQFNACSKQWGSSDLGAQYGGFLTSCTGTLAAKKDCVRQKCMKIPAGPARDGCNWFVDWFNVADNPKFTSQPTDCPF